MSQSVLTPFYSVFHSASVITTTLSSTSLVQSPVSFSLLLIPSGVFFISVIVFFIFVWLFFIFSNSLLKTLNFSVYPFFFQFSDHLYSHYLELFLGQIDYLHFTQLFWGLNLVPLLGPCFYVASFCQNCCFHVYVSGRLITFPDLGEVAFCRSCPNVSEAQSPLVTRAVSLLQD